MEKNIRLRKNTDFQDVFKKGRNTWNRQFTLIIKRNNLRQSRVGFTITKKYGTAVERNKLKRRLREIIRTNKDLLIEDHDMILIPKACTKTMTYQALESSVRHVFNFTKKKMKK